MKRGSLPEKQTVGRDEHHQQKYPEQQAPENQLLFDRQKRLVRHFPEFVCQPGLFHGRFFHTCGGLTPWKKIQEIANPIQMMKPNRHSIYTSARRPIPSSHSLRKFETSPMVKNVITKKIPRKTPAWAMAALA